MAFLPVAKVVLDADLGLLVVPDSRSTGPYEHIYREANGLRWNREHSAFCAFEPKRWQAEELLRHIAATLADAFGEELHFTLGTSWHGVPAELQSGLRKVIPFRD
jgi:hypothetical protein